MPLVDLDTIFSTEQEAADAVVAAVTALNIAIDKARHQFDLRISIEVHEAHYLNGGSRPCVTSQVFKQL